MEYINVGKIVNTFGIKGELKIVSRFERPDLVFKVGNKIRINNNEYCISSIRIHKYNYLITINNLKDINDVEHLIGFDVFFNKDLLNMGDDEYLISELLGYEVYTEKLIGKVLDYDNNKINPLIKVNNFYIPIKGSYIKNVDKVKKIIYCENIEGLIL